MSTQTTDLVTLLAQLQTLLGSYQSNPSRAGAAQIVQLAQEWLAADPNAPASLTSLIANLAGADPFALQSMVTNALPQIQQNLTTFLSQNPQDAPQPVSPGQPHPTPGGTGGSGVGGIGGVVSPPTDPNQTKSTDSSGNTITEPTAMDIINAALSTVGLSLTAVASSGVDAGQTLGAYFWNQIVSQGLTDPTTIGDMIATMLPSTGQFQVAFPGYQAALQNGYVRTVAEYVQAEEGITAVMLQGGVPKDLINPTTVGDLIAKGVSVNEVAQRVNNGLDAALNAPAEVQNYFAQEFGQGNSTRALATVFLNPDINDVTLQKMLAGAQIRGAFAASNLTVSQGLSQRFADQGQTYASALQAAKALNQQRGLFEQTVGEQLSQAPVPGTTNANRPLDINDQGIQAVLGTNAADEQQVHQVALERQNDFRGGGGASTTQAEGFSGLAEAKAF